MEINSSSLKNTARLAGVIYLIWIITGLYSIFYVPSKTMVPGDAAATAQNMLAHEFLFRTGIINDLFSNTLWVFLVLFLYRLFKQVNERQARLLVAFVVVQIPVVFFTEAFSITSLMLFKGEILKTFQVNQRQDLAMLFLSINDYITMAIELFWGLWLLPFGVLVMRSGFIPRFLGIWLLINGTALLITGFIGILFPQYKDIVFKITLPALFGEVAIMLWLLIKGVKTQEQKI